MLWRRELPSNALFEVRVRPMPSYGQTQAFAQFSAYTKTSVRFVDIARLQAVNVVQERKQIASRAIQEHLALVPQLGLDQRLVHVLQLEMGGCNTVQHHASGTCSIHNMAVSICHGSWTTACQWLSMVCVDIVCVTFFDANRTISQILHYGLDGNYAVHVRLGAQPFADPEALDVHATEQQVGDVSLRVMQRIQARQLLNASNVWIMLGCATASVAGGTCVMQNHSLHAGCHGTRKLMNQEA